MVYGLSGDDPWEPTLTPGAYWAKKKGCTCSRLDNNFGLGHPYIIADGEPDDPTTPDIWDVEFAVTPGCPLHDLRTSTNGDSE